MSSIQTNEIRQRFEKIQTEWNLFTNEITKDEFLNSIKDIYDLNLQIERLNKNLFEIEQKFQQSKFISEFYIEKLVENIEQLEKQFEQFQINFKTNSINEKQIVDNNNNEEEILVYLDPNAPVQVHHHVKFSNNIVRYLKGPFKTLVQGIMNAADTFAQHTEIDPLYFQLIQEKIDKQKHHSIDPLIRPTFTEITSEWKLEGENEDQGYSSPSIWIHDPQQRRILIKIQPLPLCAANEWLAYIIGKYLNLPVNEVQISIYKNDLVTLHTDDENPDEQTVTFMDLKKDQADLLLKQPILEYMDIFDHFIQNVDRNQQNILIIAPKSIDLNENKSDIEKIPIKIRLIDHASSFGMGKLSGISPIAAKFHSNHLSKHDRPVICRILEHLAAINDQQFENWLDEVKDLLTINQYDRILNVLKRQRDIAKDFFEQWNNVH